MKNIDLPFNKDFIDNAVKEHNTPFHIYDEKSIIENLNRFKNAFDWVLGFKNYYAVKACPNPHILDILKNE
jgi:diaminopimelate decarboxylase